MLPSFLWCLSARADLEMSVLAEQDPRTTCGCCAHRREVPAQLMGSDTHWALSERFCTYPAVFLCLREAASELLLRAVALFAQEHQETGQGAGHFSPSPNSSRICWRASPGAAGRTRRSAALGWVALQL